MQRMIAALLAGSACVIAAGIFDAHAATPGVPVAAAETYWRCEPGFSFETSGSSVHCKKPAWVDRRGLVECKLGLYPAVDRIGDKDMCSGTNVVTGEISVERACSPADVLLGFTKKIVDGADYCAKTVAAQFRAPSVMVTL
jgi:hypothetical protein